MTKQTVKIPKKGYAIHIGLNYVEPTHYDGWNGQLTACENDARDMADLSKSQGFSTIKTLLRKTATRDNVIKELNNAAKKLKNEDLFLLTYSGHGGKLPDKNGDERDHQDETWCLFDGEIVDDELFYAYTQFDEGVRIVVLSDSCHSGTVTRAANYVQKLENVGKRYRSMPKHVALRTYTTNKTFYDKILSNPVLKESNPFSKKYNSKLKATVRLLSGCQDNQESSDGDFNGLFTATLLEVWNAGTFEGTYSQLMRKILRLMPSDQTPNHYLIGKHNSVFNSENAFTI